jgi:ABC-type tungstate transport system permease subunit
MVVMRQKLAAAILIGSAIFAGGPSRADETIVLASTTSVENSGLLAHILPQFTNATGISVHVLAQGTGQALATAAHGDADLVLAHDPEAEQQFIAQGHGVDRLNTAAAMSAYTLSDRGYAIRSRHLAQLRQQRRPHRIGRRRSETAEPLRCDFARSEEAPRGQARACPPFCRLARFARRPNRDRRL